MKAFSQAFINVFISTQQIRRGTNKTEQNLLRDNLELSSATDLKRWKKSEQDISINSLALSNHKIKQMNQHFTNLTKLNYNFERIFKDSLALSRPYQTYFTKIIYNTKDILKNSLALSIGKEATSYQKMKKMTQHLQSATNQHIVTYSQHIYYYNCNIIQY